MRVEGGGGGVGVTQVCTAPRKKMYQALDFYPLAHRFRSSNHIDIISKPRPEERAFARVSKDGHRRDRASVHPSRRRASHGSSG